VEQPNTNPTTMRQNKAKNRVNHTTHRFLKEKHVFFDSSKH
jgi:hypothetical protein